MSLRARTLRVKSLPDAANFLNEDSLREVSREAVLKFTHSLSGSGAVSCLITESRKVVFEFMTNCDRFRQTGASRVVTPD